MVVAWAAASDNPNCPKGETMTSGVKKVLAVALAVAISFAMAFSAQAADYPTKPIKIIVPYGPGGDSDLSSRIYANALEKVLGVPVVVINKAGGGGVVATTVVASAKPDGYTLVQASLSTIQISPYFSKTPYTLDSFTPIIKMMSQPLGIVVKADSPFKTFDDLVATAKKRSITMGSYGASSAGTIFSNIIAEQKGYTPRYVNAATGAESAVAVVGGHIDAAMSMPPIFLPHLKAGTLRVLVLNRKIDGYPDMHTFADYGVKGNFEGWGGFFAPKGTPKEVVTTLIDASKKVMSDPAVLKEIANLGIKPDFRYGEDWINDMKAFNEVMKKTAAKMKK